MKCLLEICASTYSSALAAAEAGASRIELCSGLSEGGLTPSVGLIKAARRLPSLTLHVLIRPRGGDFLYTRDEKALMIDDIKMAADCGADGIVVGALTPNGDVDVEAMSQFIAAADGLPVTFHRAFDVCRAPLEAVEAIIKLGCCRLLSSGQATTATEGIPLLRQLVKQTAGRLVIMAGCGVNATNALRILRETGVSELHASATAPVASRMAFRRTDVAMGKGNADEYAVLESSATLIRHLLSVIEQA